MSALVFGGTGYLGRHLVQRLASELPVTGFARDERGATAVVAAGGAALIGTLDDLTAVRAAIDAHDHIIWAAQLMLEPEQDFVRTVLSWLEGSGKTFIFTSGTGVISERTDGDWSEASFAEDDTFMPRGLFELRATTEEMVRRAGETGVRTIVVRPPAIWGNGGTAMISEIYRSVAKTGAACYVGRGLNCYSSVHVDDLADLYALALETAPSGALYHAVSGEMPFRVLAGEVARQLGVPTRSVAYGEAREIFGASVTAVLFSANSRSRCPRARSELGWTPRGDRLDIFAECAHPVYRQAADTRGSWMSDGERKTIAATSR